MASSLPPPKPWERSGGASSNGPSPFTPSTPAASTAEVVSASGVRNDGDGIPGQNSEAHLGRPMPARPWESTAATTSGLGGMATPYNRTGYGTSFGGAGAGGYMGQRYGGAMGGSTYGGYGAYGSAGLSGLGGGGAYGARYGGYGGSMMGSSLMGGGYGGYGSGVYGGYGGGYGSGGYGMGMGGMGGAGMYGMAGGPMMGGDMHGPDGPGDEPRAPGFWMSMLRVMHGVMTFFGRLSILVDENTHAFHFFITALLQLCDRAGVLYGELARFVLRVLGFRTKPGSGGGGKKMMNIAGGEMGGEGLKAGAMKGAASGPRMGLPVGPNPSLNNHRSLAPGAAIAAPAPSWDSVWEGH